MRLLLNLVLILCCGIASCREEGYDFQEQPNKTCVNKSEEPTHLQEQLNKTCVNEPEKFVQKQPNKKPEDQTLDIVGAVAGIGILKLVLVSCLRCYIARRHKSKDPEQQLSTQTPSQPPHRQNFLQRTFTLARDRIIQSRPLPRIPSAVIEEDENSGVYDSIRSSSSDVQFNCCNNNNNRITHNYDNVIISKMNKLSSNENVSQQLSDNSSSSHIHPTDVIMHLDNNDATKPKVVSTVSDLVETDECYMSMRLVNRNDVAAVSQTDDICIEPHSAKSSDQDIKTLVNDITQASANQDSFCIYPNNFRIPSDNSYVNVGEINAKPIVADEVQKPKPISKPKPAPKPKPASKPKPAPKPKPNPKPKYENVEKSECDAEALHSNDKQTSDYDNLFYKRSENEDVSKDSPNVNCVNYKNTTVNQIHSYSITSDNDSDTYLSMNIAKPVENTSEDFNKSEILQHKDVLNCDVNNSKEIVCKTDSSGYMPMKGCVRTFNKLELKKQDSIFPNLMSFKVHGISDQPKSCEDFENPGACLETLKSNKNKLKRYVKKKP